MKKNPVGWFEIPVADMARAVKFYESVFSVRLSRIPLGPLEMALFPDSESGIGSAGSLVRNEQHYKPSADGVLIYFTAISGNVSIELERAEKAGGKILIPRKQISDEFGFMGVFLDSEGNRIAVHSRT
jgi:hypothetical protein